MKASWKVASVAVLAATVGTAAAHAADLPLVTKALAAAPVAAASQFDLAFGSALASNYYFRGITQSNHRPSFNAYVEPRYGWLYAGVAGTSISLPNRAAAEVDIYGGVRPVFGPLSLDFGAIYYAYPGGRTFNGLGGPETCTNGFFTPTGFCNTIKGRLDYVEAHAKGTYTVTDAVAIGGNVFYSPNFLNFGAESLFASGTVKVTAPSAWFPSDWGAFLSAEVGRFWFGTTDAFYGTPAFPGGIKLPDYTTWNLGLALTYKVFTLDLRYHDTDLSRAECNALTGDFTARFDPGAVTTINPSGLGSRWCGAAFIAKLSADLTLNANIK